MKSSMKTVFVLLAIVMSFVTVQAVWADGPSTNKTEVTVQGKVTGVSRDTASITVLDELQNPNGQVSTTVYGLGSQNYWREMGVDVPSVNEYVRILAYKCEDHTDSDSLVAIDVAVCVCVVTASQAIPDIPNCTNGDFVCDPEVNEEVEFIQLRSYDKYIPLWRGIDKAAGVTGR